MELNTVNQFDITRDQIGSAYITASYPEGSMFRLVADNGKTADAAVRLYEDQESGTYFATTNGQPITEDDFRNEGAMSIAEATEYVRAL